ncbi:MAG: substrate-binding domain-containing protein, partial [Verrucomicrobiota bacterium]
MKISLLLILVAFTLSSALRADAIKIVGSDLLIDALSKPLETYAEEHGVELTLDLYGSIPALRQIRNDEAQLAIIADPSSEKYIEPDMTVVPFAYQVAYVVVNQQNPLTEINMDQLSGIFGTASETYYTRWGELGLGGGMATRSIQPIVMSRPNSVVIELFKMKALDRSPLKPNITQIEDYESNTELIAGDSGAIAVFPYMPDDRSLRALNVAGAGDQSGIAYDPTRENVYYRDYPMTLPFYLVFRPADQPKLAGILRFLLSPDMSDKLEEAGFVPLPDNPRKRT